MALGFKLQDVIHRIVVKFTRSYLPGAKKPYYLKAAHQQELDIHAIASKADIYNLTVSPKTIEEGLLAGFELMYYLAADGYIIRTPLFTLRIRFPGEYEGYETRLQDKGNPIPRFQANGEFRRYIQDKVQPSFDGVEERDGFIATCVDEVTGLEEEAATMGNILTILGGGLKIDSQEEQRENAGIYFEAENGEQVKVESVPVNSPRTLKILVPLSLTPGAAYRLAVYTQSSVKHGGGILKSMREMRSDFTLTAQEKRGVRNEE